MSPFGNKDKKALAMYAELMRAYSIAPPGQRVTPALTPKPALPVHLVAGPTLGYRAWSVSPAGLLVSAHATEWRPGVPVIAQCLKDDGILGFNTGFGQSLEPQSTHAPHGIAPEPYCSCGVYGYHAAPHVASAEQSAGLGGTVALWGRVIEHRLGYRGQYAYPVAFWPLKITSQLPPGFPARNRDLWERVAATYGVPLLDGPPTPPNGGAPC